MRWTPVDIPPESIPSDQPWLVLTDEGGRIAEMLSEADREWALSWAFVFRSLSAVMSSVKAVMSDLDTSLSDEGRAAAFRRLVPDIKVAHLWEWPEKDLASAVFSELQEILQAHSLKDRIRITALASRVPLDSAETWLPRSASGRFGSPEVMALLLAAQASHVAVLHFGASMNELVARMRVNDYDALTNAVRVDPSVITCPSASRLIERASVERRTAFFTRLATSLMSPLSADQRHDADLQFFFSMIARSGGLSRLSYKIAQLIFLEIEPPLFESPAESGPENLSRRLRSFKARRKVLPERSSSL